MNNEQLAMNKLFTIILLLMVNIGYCQLQVELRDVSFSVPQNLSYFSEQDKIIDYDGFYEVGKIFTDSSDLDKFPKIQYQYYEMPNMGIESSKTVLTRLNEIMTKDFPADTLLINTNKNYSIAKYAIMGISLFEMKSLGGKGLINIQYFDIPANDKESFLKCKDILTSIKHTTPYISEYDEHMKASGNASKYVLLFLGIFIVVYFLRKLFK